MKRTFGRFSNLGGSTTIRDVLIPVWAREYPIEVLRKRRCKPSVIRCPRIAGSSRLQFSEACIMNTGWRRLLHDAERPWKSFLRRTACLLVQRVLAVFKPLQLMVEVESRERSNPPWNR